MWFVCRCCVLLIHIVCRHGQSFNSFTGVKYSVSTGIIVESQYNWNRHPKKLWSITIKRKADCLSPIILVFNVPAAKHYGVLVKTPSATMSITWIPCLSEEAVGKRVSSPKMLPLLLMLIKKILKHHNQSALFAPVTSPDAKLQDATKWSQRCLKYNSVLMPSIRWNEMGLFWVQDRHMQSFAHMNFSLSTAPNSHFNSFL